MVGMQGPGYAAIVLAGGAGKRLGGPAKPILEVGGRPMLHRVLDAVADASPQIVVGPPELPLPPHVLYTQEQPPGGGPAAATAAGLARLPAHSAFVALLAADLPLFTTEAAGRLRRAANGTEVDGAVFVDDTGRLQWLCGVWRTSALRARLAALGSDPAGTSLRALLGELRIAQVSVPAPDPPPWFDCDTRADLRHAERWT